MQGRKPFERLNETERGERFVFHGELLQVYWKDEKLLTKYKNCTEFLDKVESSFDHVLTTIRWEEQFGDKEKVVSEFKNWLIRELGHNELLKCFENTTRKKISDLKEYQRNGLI